MSVTRVILECGFTFGVLEPAEFNVPFHENSELQEWEGHELFNQASRQLKVDIHITSDSLNVNI